MLRWDEQEEQELGRKMLKLRDREMFSEEKAGITPEDIGRKEGRDGSDDLCSRAGAESGGVRRLLGGLLLVGSVRRGVEVGEDVTELSVEQHWVLTAWDDRTVVTSLCKMKSASEYKLSLVSKNNCVKINKIG